MHRAKRGRFAGNPAPPSAAPPLLLLQISGSAGSLVFAFVRQSAAAQPAWPPVTFPGRLQRSPRAMAVKDDSPRPHNRPRTFSEFAFRIAVVVLLPAGLAWLGLSAWQA